MKIKYLIENKSGIIEFGLGIHGKRWRAVIAARDPIIPHLVLSITEDGNVRDWRATKQSIQSLQQVGSTIVNTPLTLETLPGNLDSYYKSAMKRAHDRDDEFTHYVVKLEFPLNKIPFGKRTKAGTVIAKYLLTNIIRKLKDDKMLEYINKGYEEILIHVAAAIDGYIAP